MRPASRHSPYITSKIITGVRRSANYLISLALAVLDTEHGPRRGLQVTVVAQWGGISLARDLTPTVLNDDPPKIWSGRRSELVQRLLADTCELCGSQHQVEVHHIRALKDLNPKGRKEPPEWVVRMASRRRKTLVVCRACHEGIHYSGHASRQT